MTVKTGGRNVNLLVSICPEWVEANKKMCFLRHFFLGITKPWCTIVTFDMRYSKSCVDASYNFLEHLPTTSVILKTSNYYMGPTLIDFGDEMEWNGK
jgi:hypothetical protein